MVQTVTHTSTWKPQLLDSERAHIESLGLRAAKLNGSPYSTHLKFPGGEKPALCGAYPGKNKNRKMTARAYWSLYAEVEAPGRPLCEKCLKAAEKLTPAGVGSTS